MFDKKFVVIAALAAIAFVGPNAEARNRNESAAPVAAAPAAGPATWMTDAGAARRRAAAENKPILYFFTGSDWCPWCKLLKQEVFDTAEFRSFAAQNLVLVEIDAPHHKRLPGDLERQNSRLADQFRIDSRPTVVVLNSRARTIGSLGYGEGGPKAWLRELNKILRRR